MTTDITPPKLIERTHKCAGNNGWYARYLCYCGNEFVARVRNVVQGGTRSCGCYAVRRSKDTHTTHGGTGTKAYGIWQGMRARCLCPSNANYKNYGGRGISICDRWMDFKNFFDDMGECPDGYSIERLDVEGDYCPSNCVWIPLRKQPENMRRTIRLTYRDETKTLREWSAVTGISLHALRERVRNGWSVDRILTQPQQKRGGGLCH